MPCSPPPNVPTLVLCSLGVLLILICVYYAGKYSTKKSVSWGKFGGNCFEVLETGEAGCQPSYTDKTTVTLSVH